ncbi:MAG TPA: bacterial transcriptional activator domain-containing protein, partial [Acidimicrobiales bacterium]|nr:bacterial transcriptional activator domain-containing protein [Acidimicrobiales bacterium]
AVASDSGDRYFVASVPADSPDVVLQMASGGFSQSFSLTHMTREGDQPAPLYRTPGSWQTVDQADASKVLTTPYQAHGTSLPNSNLEIDLAQAAISEFGPDGANDPAPAGQAWLTLQLSDPYSYDADNLYYRTPLTPAALTLQLPGRSAIHPTRFPGGPDNPAVEPRTNDLFSDQFAFLVPAATTSATLTIDPGAQMVNIPGNINTDTVTVPPATFDLTFAAPATPAPPAGAATPPATMAAIRTPVGAADGQPRHSSSGSGFPVGAAIALVTAILIGAVGVIAIRRRATPATAGPPGPHPPPSGPHVADQPPPTATATNGHFQPSAYSPSTSAEYVQASDGQPLTARATAPTGCAEPVPAAVPASGVAVDAPAAAAPTEEAAAPAVEPEPAPPPLRIADPLPRVRLLEPPAGPPPLQPGEVRFRFAGRPLSEGLPHGTGSTVEEIIGFLALHPGERFTGSQLQIRLGSAGRPRGFSTDSITRYMSEARQHLGEDRIPKGGYEAIGLDTDVTAIAESIAEAATATDPVGRAVHLAAALAWVRGGPFADLDPGDPWAWGPDDSGLCTRLAIQIHDAAIELADLALSAGDATLAAWAAEQGLLAEKTDQPLMCRLLRAGHLQGRFDLTWAQINARLARDGDGTTPGPELLATCDELRSRRQHGN